MSPVNLDGFIALLMNSVLAGKLITNNGEELAGILGQKADEMAQE